MIDLTLSILCTSLIFVVFRLYRTYNINTVNAIVVNYICACTVGLVFYDGPVGIGNIVGKPWIPGTILLGILFITVFNLMARTSQQLGVSVASVATKMSLVIPVLVGVWLYEESLSTLKVFGILLALTAVYFASIKRSPLSIGRGSLWLPALVFLGSGIIDASIKFLEEFYVDPGEFSIFSASVFASAAISGMVFLLLQRKFSFRGGSRDLIGGIALGIPNFFSIYFLLRAFQFEGWNSATVFTINNVAIVMLTTLLGIVLFKEKVDLKNWMGIVLAVISIIMVALF